MRVLVDYRSALRARTGVGEWTHNLARAVARHPAPRPSVTAFVSSWKDRPLPAAIADLPGAEFVDRRVPVRALTWAWHHLEWPPVEWLARRRFDVAYSPTPLLVPSTAPVRVVTAHDLDFFVHPERARGEMRRDYPALVASHATRADLVVAVSHFTAGEASRLLGLPPEKIAVVRPGIPDWIPDAAPVSPGSADGSTGYILFVGTIEARKNVAGLLEAYARLVAAAPDAPRLVLAGGATPEAAVWLARAAQGPAAGRVEALGYIQPDHRAALYAGAAMLVLPSYMEGFGLPVLEAMALGVPVVTSTCGALPEVAGDAGLLVHPDDREGLAEAMRRVWQEPGLAQAMRERGRRQARAFTWDGAARTFIEACAGALARARVAPRGGRTPDHANRH